MSRHSQIRQHSFREFLNILGDEFQLDTEFHVHYNSQPVSENPFPYPFRGNNSGVMMLLQGRFSLKINHETFVAGPNDIILLSPKFIVHVFEVIEPVRMIGLIFTLDYALKNNFSFKEINTLRFLSSTEKPVLSLPQSKSSTIFSLLDTMYILNLQNTEKDYYKNEKIFHYFNLVGLEITEEYQNQIADISIKTSRKKQIIHAFFNLLSEHAGHERSVRFYADKLFITPGHLSKILRESSGNTARDVIEEAVVLEARELLMDTSLSLAEIADKLNFSDQSFFGKFFKKKMKVTPKAFRDKYK